MLWRRFTDGWGGGGQGEEGERRQAFSGRSLYDDFCRDFAGRKVFLSRFTAAQQVAGKANILALH